MILNAMLFGDEAAAPVILLHGLFGAARNLGGIARGLAADYRVAAFDLRNHGDSPHDAVMDYAAMAADVAETARELGIEAAAVIGHSMGGKVAMALALTRPGLVSRLAVLDIAPVAYDHGNAAYARAMLAIPLSPALTRQQADDALAAAVPEAALRSFLLNNLRLGAEPRWRVGLDEVLAAMPALLDWTDPPGWLAYEGPALFLRGGESDYVSAAAAAVAARFPHAVQRTIDGAGHWLHAEKPAQVIAALKEFLSP